MSLTQLLEIPVQPKCLNQCCKFAEIRNNQDRNLHAAVHISNTAIGSSSRVSAPKGARNHRRAKSTPTSITDAGTTAGNTNSDLNCSESVNPRSRKLELDPAQSVAVSDLTNESLMSITKRFAAVGADIGATIGAATAKHVPKLRPDAQGTVGTIVGGVVGGTVGAVVGLAVGLWKKWWV